MHVEEVAAHRDVAEDEGARGGQERAGGGVEGGEGGMGLGREAARVGEVVGWWDVEGYGCCCRCRRRRCCCCCCRGEGEQREHYGVEELGAHFCGRGLNNLGRVSGSGSWLMSLARLSNLAVLGLIEQWLLVKERLLGSGAGSLTSKSGSVNALIGWAGKLFRGTNFQVSADINF